MVQYKCESCEYKTNKKTDYTRHIQTKKHIEKVHPDTTNSNSIPIRVQSDSNSNDQFICNYCNNVYSSQSNLTKHIKKCFRKINANIEIENLKKENERIQKQAIEKEEFLKKQLLKTEKRADNYEEMIKSLTCPQTINNITFIIKMYSDAPALEKLPSYGHMLEAKSMTFVEVVIMYGDDKKLDRFIGDFIVKTYKKDDPEEQSMWSSDIARLTYIINESCKNGKTNWSYDKGGVRLKECIVEPILQYIRKELFNYYQKNMMCTETYQLKRQLAINNIIKIIDDDSLGNNIIKYIAPKFSIGKNIIKEKKKLLV